MSTNFVVKENVLEEVTEFSHVNLGLSRNTAWNHRSTAYKKNMKFEKSFLLSLLQI